MSSDLSSLKAIVFDTFGTLVDWRGSIVRDLSAWGPTQGLDPATDWAHLADLWRGRYQPQMQRVRSGERPFAKLDALHDESLRELLPQVGVTGLSEAQIRHVNLVWHRLDPWPDVVAGLTRLKRHYVIGPLSNGNISLLVDLARHGGLPWDCIFSAEHFEHYKPQPEVYLGVPRQLDLAPRQVMLCAAHNDDLAAAREAGLRTAFVPRPTEYGPGRTIDLAPNAAWDVVGADLLEVAQRLATPAD